ncbi:sodium-coupled monocarboxylate transporter 2-like [Haliotis rufescens]|uniref:sodium-coupled monocarboxylate transporter 2-like n=1 Tax=Haliotis rufescens TaxID=6454 RepID=UPI00201F7D79|nr:sodium-coupled monocarboxylate transporter 2-like [Haliotis rufescens]XP_046353962.2 sodium-coupled monocarboxylate transporter 2-like [Haliotis rufescens]XP_046353963.2 sodium-coupled monocarboxylate transporter 2-like [Haliotis rufescens]
MEGRYSINSGTKNTLHWEDYLVFGCTLLIPACVGFYHAVTDRKKNSPSDFLVGSRQMGTVPVALSVTVTFLSALTLLGMPAEVYNHDTMFWWLAVGMIIAVAGAAHLFIPFLYRLGVTSVYEYFELRFGKRVRILASLNWIIQVLLYMAFVLYAPSLALYSVTGFDLWLSISTVGIIVTLYTALGGMKTVLWTDSLQTVVIIVGLVSLLVQGSLAVGGLTNAWRIAEERGRLRFFDFDPNPGVRHSVWSVVCGGGIMWMSQLGVNQTQVQRLMSCPTLRKAKTALWLSSIGLVVIVTFCTLTGVVLHAFYRDCDPLKFQNLITSSDELLPLFAMDIFVNTRVLPGIFLACIFSGSLSTLSSGLNALAAVILEDYIRVFCCTRITDFRATVVSKCLVLLCGAVSLAVAYLVSSFGNILQMCYSIQSIMDGPLFGLFVLGMFCPCANSVGATAGFFTSLAFMLWIGIGAYVNGVSTPTSYTSVDGCNWETTGYNNTDLQSVYNITKGDIVQASESEISEKNYYSIYDLSYLNYTATGMTVTVGIGVLVSLATRRFCKGPPGAAKYSHPVLDVICPCLPESLLSVFRCSAPEQEYQAAPVNGDTDVKDSGF